MVEDIVYNSPSNPRFMGQRQYPVNGANSSGTLDPWSDSDTETDITSPLNLLKSTKGGEPARLDDGDGIGKKRT